MNLIEQLKHGVGATRMPVDTLLSNWAFALRLPETGLWASAFFYESDLNGMDSLAASRRQATGGRRFTPSSVDTIDTSPCRSNSPLSWLSCSRAHCSASLPIKPTTNVPSSVTYHSSPEWQISSLLIGACYCNGSAV